jgi:hypothetical protein
VAAVEDSRGDILSDGGSACAKDGGVSLRSGRSPKGLKSAANARGLSTATYFTCMVYTGKR